MHARHDSHVSERAHFPLKESFLEFLFWVPVNVLQALSLGLLCAIMIPLAIAARKISGSSVPALWMARKVWAPVILAGGLARLRVSGSENLSRVRTALIVSNHRSYSDIPILYRVLPVGLNFAAKKEVERMPLIGTFGRSVGMIFLDRSTHQRAAKGILDLIPLTNKKQTIQMRGEGIGIRDEKITGTWRAKSEGIGGGMGEQA